MKLLNYPVTLKVYFFSRLMCNFQTLIEMQLPLFQELPYHLEKLLDHSRLARCLLEWPVFEKLSADEHNIELLRSWRKVTIYN